MKRCIYNYLASRSLTESDFKSSLTSIFIFLNVMHWLDLIFTHVREFQFQWTPILISILINMAGLIYNSLTLRSLMENDFKSVLPSIFIFVHCLYVIFAFIRVFPFQITTIVNSILIYENECVYNHLASRVSWKYFKSTPWGEFLHNI